MNDDLFPQWQSAWAQAGEIKRLGERPGEVLFALWFHDAVYDTHARENLRRSVGKL